MNIDVSRGSDSLVFRLELRCPPSRVFHAFEDSETLAKWWSPPTCPIVESTADFRVGGVWFYRLFATEISEDIWSRAVFEEIVEDRRIAFVETSADSSGKVTADRAPAHTVLELERSEAGTLLTVTVSFETPDDHRAALGRGIVQGMSTALAQLQEILLNQKGTKS